uniref:Chitin-binding type-2 domain-containing protein n=1 Tax=Strigamia maritima TaxID=126957 RepID=T1IPI5_STRMM
MSLDRFRLLLAALLVILTVDKSTSQPNITRPGRFICPYTNGLFADPALCRRFYSCTNYEAFLQSCPPGLFFDDIKKFCTFKNEVTCGPVDYETTPTPTVDPNDPYNVKKCDLSACNLPDCFCSVDGTRIPGGLSREEVPQMIMLMFSGAVNLLNYPQYNAVLGRNRTNPNGCPIGATFFMSHEYTNYHYVSKLHSEGHEIAVNSISRSKPESLWYRGSYENWTLEMVGMREILIRYAEIPKEEILGVRAPYLKTGGNEQFDMLNDYGFLYDSSMAAPPSKIPLWPFSMEYKIPFKCKSENCPQHSYPGIWEIPLNTLHTEDGLGGNCPMMDQCVFPHADEETIYEWLLENFDRHYRKNRAPLALNMQSNWFLTEAAVNGLKRFVNDMLNRDDVWFVTATQALHWLVDPAPLTNINKFDPWKCEVPRAPSCNLPRTCVLPFSAPGIVPDLRYMQTCVRCPKKYPWIGNVGGEVKTTQDFYEPEITRGPPKEALDEEFPEEE